MYSYWEHYQMQRLNLAGFHFLLISISDYQMYSAEVLVLFVVMKSQDKGYIASDELDTFTWFIQRRKRPLKWLESFLANASFFHIWPTRLKGLLDVQADRTGFWP